MALTAGAHASTGSVLLSVWRTGAARRALSRNSIELENFDLRELHASHSRHLIRLTAGPAPLASEARVAKPRGFWNIGEEDKQRFTARAPHQPFHDQVPVGPAGAP